MRITVACPEGLFEIGNRIFAHAFPETGSEPIFHAASWVNIRGEAFACASWETDTLWTHRAGTPLQGDRADPDWDLLDSWPMDADTPPPEARSDRIVALIGLAGADAIGAMGLSVIPSDQRGDA